MNENVRQYLIKTIESMDDDNLLAVRIWPIVRNMDRQSGN